MPNNKKRKIGEISNSIPNQDLTNESDQNNYDDFKSDLPEPPQAKRLLTEKIA